MTSRERANAAGACDFAESCAGGGGGAGAAVSPRVATMAGTQETPRLLWSGALLEALKKRVKARERRTRSTAELRAERYASWLSRLITRTPALSATPAWAVRRL